MSSFISPFNLKTDIVGLEPATLRLTAGCSAIELYVIKSEREVSNLRHAGYKPVALPLSYVPLADGNSYTVSIGVPILPPLLRFFCQKTIFNNIECYTTIFYCYILFWSDTATKTLHLPEDVANFRLLMIRIRKTWLEFPLIHHGKSHILPVWW